MSNQALQLGLYWAIVESIDHLIIRNQRPGFSLSTRFRLREFRLVFGGILPIIWLANTVNDDWLLLQVLGFGVIITRFVFLKDRAGT